MTFPKFHKSHSDEIFQTLLLEIKLDWFLKNMTPNFGSSPPIKCCVFFFKVTNLKNQGTKFSNVEVLLGHQGFSQGRWLRRRFFRTRWMREGVALDEVETWEWQRWMLHVRYIYKKHKGSKKKTASKCIYIKRIGMWYTHRYIFLCVYISIICTKIVYMHSETCLKNCCIMTGNFKRYPIMLGLHKP